MLGADNLFNIGWRVRAVLTLAFVGGNAAVLVAVLVYFFRRKRDFRKLAVDLERVYGIDDNCLINAIEFAESRSIPVEVKHYFMAIADRRSSGLSLKHLWSFVKLRRLAWSMAAAGLVFALYLAFFGRHAGNALVRYLDPRTSLTPLNYTQFSVDPGDTRLAEGTTCGIKARAVKNGVPVNRLELLVRPKGGSSILYTMRQEDGESLFDLAGLADDCEYRVRNQRDLSKWFRIAVAPRPDIEKLSVQVAPPPYSGLEAYPVSPFERRCNVLKNSNVTIAPNCPRRVQPVFLAGDEEIPDVTNLEFTADTPRQVRLDVIDRDGLRHVAVWSCSFAVVEDRPPTVRFINREMNHRLALGQTLELHPVANDDCGIRTMEILTDIGETEVSLKQWRFSTIIGERREVAFIDIDPELFSVNATYRFWCRATDNFEPAQKGKTALPVTVHVIDPAALVGEVQDGDDYGRVFALLQQALTEQRKLQTQTASHVNQAGRANLMNRLHSQQGRVHRRITEARAVSDRLARDQRFPENIAAEIATLADGDSRQVLDQFDNLGKEASIDKRKILVNEIALAQADIIRALQQILGEIARQRELVAKKDEQMDDAEAEKDLFERLEKLRDELADYREEQRELLDRLEDIDKKEPEDWTAEEEALLGDLVAKQNDMANFFRSAFNDLSKLENQDFSNSMLAEELVELYEELQKAGEALEGKQTEIATIAEQMGVELAESIETNLERWLADQKDTTKWNAEESGEFPDVPLQDLPQELTDIVGDLIDSVEDMTESEDSTNSYLGSFDEGAGWGVSDGNIDDMSAKGITGNIMPNDNEVGGRSGEGRSGKSSGQFVEETATGKGGRDTPTRLTHSPFEAGTVADSSTDPQGGATGGGKQSGTGGEGLRGITPDQDPDVAERLPGNQIELKQKAEALMRTLTIHNLPTGDLEEAIAAMDILTARGSNAPGIDLRQVHSDAIASLREAGAAVSAALRSGVDVTRRRGPASDWTVKYQTEERVPPGYEATVEAYFRSLAQ